MNLLKRVLSPMTVTTRWKHVALAAGISVGACLGGIALIRMAIPGATPTTVNLVVMIVALFLTILSCRR
jgi:hypothetical protein